MCIRDSELQEGGVQRHRHAVSPRLPDERARDELDLGRTARADVLEHRGNVRISALGGCGLAATDGVDVHLPGILVQLDTGCGGDPLSLLDEAADEVSEVARARELRELADVGEVSERGDGVDRRVEDELRPCLLYTSPSPRDRTRSRMPSSA